MKRHFLDLVIMHPPGLPLVERFRAYLAEHPDLYLAPKETHYFSSEALQNGQAWYEAHFDDAASGKKRVEWSTSYLAAPGVAARLSREYPDAKLCVLIADPIECVVAAYETATRGKTGAPDLETWLESQPKLLESYKFGRQLSSFFGYYSPVDLLVLTLGDLRDNAGKAIGRLYDHLEVSTDFVPKELSVLTEDEVKPGFLARRLRLDRLWAHRRAVRLEAARAAFPVPTIALTPRERILLSRYYEADVATLSALLHRDLRAQWQYPVLETVKTKKTKRQGS